MQTYYPNKNIKSDMEDEELDQYIFKNQSTLSNVSDTTISPSDNLEEPRLIFSNTVQNKTLEELKSDLHQLKEEALKNHTHIVEYLDNYCNIFVSQENLDCTLNIAKNILKDITHEDYKCMSTGFKQSNILFEKIQSCFKDDPYTLKVLNPILIALQKTLPAIHILLNIIYELQEKYDNLVRTNMKITEENELKSVTNSIERERVKLEFSQALEKHRKKYPELHKSKHDLNKYFNTYENKYSKHL